MFIEWFCDWGFSSFRAREEVGEVREINLLALEVLKGRECREEWLGKWRFEVGEL